MKNIDLKMAWDLSFKLVKEKERKGFKEYTILKYTDIFNERNAYNDCDSLDCWVTLKQSNLLYNLQNIEFPTSSLVGLMAAVIMEDILKFKHSIFNGTLSNRNIIYEQIPIWLEKTSNKI